MNLTAHPKARPTSQPESEPGTRAQRPKKRRLRSLGIAALAVVAVIAASTAVNLAMEAREKATTTPYGQRVPVSDGVLNVWRNGRPGPTIVLMGGLGTASPSLDFAPLARELKGYNVVVVEGFGYGYSDMTAPPRTIGNITTELHEVLSKLKITKPFVLVGHSIGGFYTLGYANRYPTEVSAVIGIDPTIPAPNANSPEPAGGGINWVRGLATTGVARWAITLAPGLGGVPTGDAYTPDELARIRRMAIWNFGSSAVVDETTRIGSNATALRGITYPDSLPVLDFLASDSVGTEQAWVKRHEDQLRNVRRHKIVVLDGGHYLHWTQSKAMAQMITDFIGQK